MRHPTLVAPTAVLTIVLAGCASDGGNQAASSSESSSGTSGPTNVAELTAPLNDPEGTRVGNAIFTDTVNGTQVRVEASGLPPGFHGMHLHEVGVCEPNSADPSDPSQTGNFLSAGPHLGSADGPHPQHTGDLPTLEVNARGFGSTSSLMRVENLEDLLKGDGTSLIIHADPDNLAHIPPRYPPGGPDQETQKAGDSGARIACGVLGH
ncbi:superoxide dismutase family protein [Geodermatophilus ruber]|uniref:Superoxide dismutase, Cu-Zn family n=1 Tax=Geodermatophilus ruber TaxID=504800 RepID=A0A1I4K210_9ACTN|nr:superoxide dismutase family protein [Geodermatophilus ruber]SFL72792.1 superoxide dismutase, Cu-Zn family [Geodermatophilus ruber]